MSDDVLYTILLLVSVAAGPLVRFSPNPRLKRIVSSLLGVAIVIFACHWDALHPLIVTLINCLLILVLGPRFCHIASFVWCFGYLAFFRSAHYFGLPRPHPVTNAVQLFNTLRMIGVAFEVFDTAGLARKPSETDEDFELRKKRQIKPSSVDIITYSLCHVGLFTVFDTAGLTCKPSETDEDFELRKKRQIKPSSVDIITYSLCHVGLFTGPYYRYRTYHDMLHQDPNANLPVYSSAIARLKQIPIIAAVYLFFSYFFSIEYVDSEAFPTNPFWFRLLYMVPMFQIFRTRLYIAWIMSELMSMTTGLGAYPKESEAQCGEGPSNLKALKQCESKDPKEIEYDFETIHNLSIWGCELAPTTGEGLRSWNMTVQYWLAACIHRRLPRSIGAMRVAVTMTVSAFWHGIHPGYYLSFLTVPPILVAEDAMMAAFRKESSSQRAIFDWGCWFFKMRGFDYMCMGFLLLTLESTLAYWNSIYFIGHIFVVAFLVLGYAFKPRRTKKLQ